MENYPPPPPHQKGFSKYLLKMKTKLYFTHLKQLCTVLSKTKIIETHVTGFYFRDQISFSYPIISKFSKTIFVYVHKKM